MIDVTVGYMGFNVGVVVFVLMIERYYPPYEQLLGLHKLLAFLSSAKIYWHEIWTSGDIIKIKVEPQKGEFDIRIFNIYQDGGLDDDEFKRN